MDDTTPSLFEQEHHRIGGRLQAHLLALVGADFDHALLQLRRWHRALMGHIHIENELLLPLVPESARWPARLYRLEHERITLLAQEYLARVEAVAARPPRSLRARRQSVLNLLDAAHALRHLLEHHHEREEMALARELPQGVLEAAWGRSGSRRQM